MNTYVIYYRTFLKARTAQMRSFGDPRIEQAAEHLCNTYHYDPRGLVVMKIEKMEKRDDHDTRNHKTDRR